MPISFNKEQRIFYLDGRDSTYAFSINFFDYAEHLYFGRKIAHDDIMFINSVSGGNSHFALGPGKTIGYMNTSTECSFFGCSDYREPTLLVKNSAGDRITELLVKGYEILDEKPSISGMPSLDGENSQTLVIHLADDFAGFAADLYYTVYPELNIVARRIVYKNLSNEVKFLERAYSFTFRLPGNDYDMLSLYGVWGGERATQRIPLHHGGVSIDSKRGVSSAVLNPFMAIMSKDATQNSGEVYAANLIYSGSFVLKTEVETNGDTLLLGGINDFDFCWKLEPGEEFETPEAVLAYSCTGLNGMSHEFHDAYRNHLIDKKWVSAPRPIVINNWEATHFDFTEEQIKNFIDVASKTKIDTFVLDDGWFGVRNDITSGLGDWFINKDKLPGGIGGLVEHAKARGMKFGIWFEPEMISEDSNLYREHPDYAIQIPGRRHCRCRGQLVLDLTREEVRQRIAANVNKILDENDISYLKWDCNRDLTEFYSSSLPADRQGEFAHRYCLGLYDLCERIIKTHPNVFFEGCASGGGRFDAGMLYYFPQIWTSDNSDAYSRTFIQYGTAIVYPLSSLSCHVTSVPNVHSKRIIDLKTRANIAQLGSTGYELDPNEFTQEELKEVDAQIDEYKAVNEELVLMGDLFQLDDPNTSSFFSQLVVSKDKSKAIFVIMRNSTQINKEIKRVKMFGLDENKKYFVKELEKIVSGTTLMNMGFPVSFPAGDYKTLKFHIDEVK